MARTIYPVLDGMTRIEIAEENEAEIHCTAPKWAR